MSIIDALHASNTELKRDFTQNNWGQLWLFHNPFTLVKVTSLHYSTCAVNVGLLISAS